MTTLTMATTDSHEVTALLSDWVDGNAQAFEDLMPHMIDALRSSADRLIRNGHTLQPTELVNEVYIELRSYMPRRKLANRFQFRKLAIQVMRRFLADYQRRQRAAKRGGDFIQVPWTEGIKHEVDSGNRYVRVDFIDLDRALRRVEALDPLLHDIVELRFLGGLRYREVAAQLDLDERQVRYKWETGRILLYQLLGGRNF